MIQPYIVNTINALILIIAGFVAYFTYPNGPLLGLIAPGLGIMLLACTYHLRKHNRFVMHTVTALTLLAAIVGIVRLNRAEKIMDTQYILLLVMALSCLATVAFFVGSFIRERRMRNNAIYKDDL